MVVAMVTGSFPPKVCGVGDYTARLVNALENQGIKIEVITGNKWGLTDFPVLLKRIRRLQPDVVHIQYPTVGYGKGLVPQVLACFRPTVVTIHEVSQAKLFRKLALYPFGFAPNQIIFTTEEERQYAAMYAPWIIAKSSIIPIGSNIQATVDPIKDLPGVVYFGLIGPRKGLEEVVRLAALLKEQGPGNFEVHIVGSPNPNMPEYYEQLRNQTRDLMIHWHIGLGETEVGSLLARFKLGFLPFPDGVSARRGSFLAMAGNAVAVLTTRGRYTPQDLNDKVVFVDSSDKALAAIRQLLNTPAEVNRIAQAGKEYYRRFSWELIADKHIELYTGITQDCC